MTTLLKKSCNGFPFTQSQHLYTGHTGSRQIFSSHALFSSCHPHLVPGIHSCTSPWAPGLGLVCPPWKLGALLLQPRQGLTNMSPSLECFRWLPNLKLILPPVCSHFYLPYFILSRIVGCTQQTVFLFRLLSVNVCTLGAGMFHLFLSVCPSLCCTHSTPGNGWSTLGAPVFDTKMNDSEMLAL